MNVRQTVVFVRRHLSSARVNNHIHVFLVDALQTTRGAHLPLGNLLVGFAHGQPNNGPRHLRLVPSHRLKLLQCFIQSIERTVQSLIGVALKLSLHNIHQSGRVVEHVQSGVHFHKTAVSLS